MNRTANASDELGFSLRGELVVHAAQGALSSTKRVISLNKASDEPVPGKLSLAKCAGKETSLVATLFHSIRYAPARGVSLKIMEVPCVN